MKHNCPVTKKKHKQMKQIIFNIRFTGAGGPSVSNCYVLVQDVIRKGPACGPSIPTAKYPFICMYGKYCHSLLHFG